jgi:hypothetical protein
MRFRRKKLIQFVLIVHEVCFSAFSLCLLYIFGNNKNSSFNSQWKFSFTRKHCCWKNRQIGDKEITEASHFNLITGILFVFIPPFALFMLRFLKLQYFRLNILSFFNLFLLFSFTRLLCRFQYLSYSLSYLRLHLIYAQHTRGWFLMRTNNLIELLINT